MVSFLKYVCPDSYSEVRLVKTLEPCMVVETPILYSPFSFAQNLLSNFISGSKSAVEIGSKGTTGVLHHFTELDGSADHVNV